MSIATVLLPLFVQVMLTFVLGFMLAASRTPPLLRGEIKPERAASDRSTPCANKV